MSISKPSSVWAFLFVVSDPRGVLTTSELREASLTVIALYDWSIIAEIAMGGPGYLLRRHANPPHIASAEFFRRNRDAMHVIDR